jgi:heptaprenyl diphosphate synthase
VVFNLLVPYGQVLFSIGLFRVTQGALLAGIQRGVTLEGLIMLSRIAIRRDLRIPGAFGELVGEAFRILALIQEQRHTITRKNFINSIDTLMVNLSESDEPSVETGLFDGSASQQTVLLSTEKHIRRGSAAPGRIILAVAVLMAWIPWI